jgi:hypothetical protein
MLLLTKSKGHESNTVTFEHVESHKQFLNIELLYYTLP